MSDIEVNATETGVLLSIGSGLVISNSNLTATCLDFGPVKVYPDGRVERTSKFTTDEEAAKSFWKAVEMYMPLDSKTKSPPYGA